MRMLVKIRSITFLLFNTQAFAMHVFHVKCCVTKNMQHNAYNFIYKTVYIHDVLHPLLVI